MPELALAVPFPGLVEPVGVGNDLPPHVTILVPCPGDADVIGDVLAPFAPFEVTFPRLETFPGVLWLAPEPAEPFAAMTEAMLARFPDWPPYGGVHDSVVPHLTVAQGRIEETAAAIEPLLPLHSRATAAVLYEHVSGEHWTDVRTFPL